jgi:hypothetical protein
VQCRGRVLHADVGVRSVLAVCRAKHGRRRHGAGPSALEKARGGRCAWACEIWFTCSLTCNYTRCSFLFPGYMKSRF